MTWMCAAKYSTITAIKGQGSRGPMLPIEWRYRTTVIVRLSAANSRRRPAMFLTHRHHRFALLLAALHVTILLLLIPHSPFAPFQSSSSPPRPSPNPSIAHQGLSARVRRAERTYQKTLRARDALIAKVGPAPRDVVLCVRSCFFFPFRYHYPHLAQIPTRQGTVAAVYGL
jgi:hypothetical protein